MALFRINISPLQERNPIVDLERRPVSSFIKALNRAFKAIATAINQQGDIVQQLADLAGIVTDQAAIIAEQAELIDDLQTEQAATNSESSIQNSGVINETGALIAADDGSISVANHDRAYGNPTLNPTVAVIGQVIATGEGPGTIVYVYYDDPTRAGGAVTYLYSTVNGDAVQTGNRHSVGSAEIPAALTQDGTYTRPRGV